MRVPFSFSFASANQECAVWDGRTTTAGANLNALAPAKPLEPTGGGVYILNDFCLMTDTADAPVQIGVWNITDDSFVVKYDVQATQVEGGGVVVPMNADPIILDCRDTDDFDSLVPAVRYIGATTAKITGHLSLTAQGLKGSEYTQAIQTAFDASVAAFIQMEDGFTLDDEVPAPLELET